LIERAQKDPKLRLDSKEDSVGAHATVASADVAVTGPRLLSHSLCEL
jgi:hypothetical protein